MKKRLWNGLCGVASRRDSVLVCASILFGAIGAANAADHGPYAMSGGLFWTPTIETPVGCRQMALVSNVWSNNKNLGDPDWNVFNEGFVVVSDCETGAGADLPVSWIRLDIRGFKSGGFCAGTTVTNSELTSAISSKVSLCSNPSGQTSFHTEVRGGFWNGNGFTFRGWQQSPLITW